jgi:hypothetical protein
MQAPQAAIFFNEFSPCAAGVALDPEPFCGSYPHDAMRDLVLVCREFVGLRAPGGASRSIPGH